MGKRVAALNVVALGTAFGLFVWANTRPEMLVVEQFDGHSYHVIRNGPGWPVRAWATDQRGTWADPVPADHILPDPFPGDRERARWEVWLVNGPIGLLLLAALALNVRQVFRPASGQRQAEPGAAPDPAA